MKRQEELPGLGPVVWNALLRGDEPFWLCQRLCPLPLLHPCLAQLAAGRRLLKTPVKSFCASFSLETSRLFDLRNYKTKRNQSKTQEQNKTKEETNFQGLNISNHLEVMPSSQPRDLTAKVFSHGEYHRYFKVLLMGFLRCRNQRLGHCE